MSFPLIATRCFIRPSSLICHIKLVSLYWSRSARHFQESWTWGHLFAND